MEKVIIELDNRWELADFAVLTKEYLQLYGFFYGLKGGSRGYSTMPWEGGHSVVNFFRGAYSATPPDLRPVVKKIQYASPGFIELSALIDISWQIAELVTAVGGSILAANKVYDQVMRTYRQREWAKLLTAIRSVTTTKKRLRDSSRSPLRWFRSSTKVPRERSRSTFLTLRVISTS